MQKTSTKTLFEYWNGLRGARSAPDRRDIDPARIRGALANTFILEAAENGEFDFRLAGSHLCTVYCRELKGRSFSRLWHPRDRDAMETLVRAVTEDHAVALITYQGTTDLHTKVSVETMLLPIRHNGSTQTRILGALTALDTPYWLGVQPIMEQKITGLRLIWPDEAGGEEVTEDVPMPIASEMGYIGIGTGAAPLPMAATVFGRSARRYAHLAVIDGGRN